VVPLYPFAQCDDTDSGRARLLLAHMGPNQGDQILPPRPIFPSALVLAERTSAGPLWTTPLSTGVVSPDRACRQRRHQRGEMPGWDRERRPGVPPVYAPRLDHNPALLTGIDLRTNANRAQLAFQLSGERPDGIGPAHPGRFMSDAARLRRIAVATTWAW
jgi:hypothetical protein